jgi:hypothetical protein
MKTASRGNKVTIIESKAVFPRFRFRFRNRNRGIFWSGLESESEFLFSSGNRNRNFHLYNRFLNRFHFFQKCIFWAKIGPKIFPLSGLKNTNFSMISKKYKWFPIFTTWLHHLLLLQLKDALVLRIAPRGWRIGPPHCYSIWNSSFTWTEISNCFCFMLLVIHVAFIILLAENNSASLLLTYIKMKFFLQIFRKIIKKIIKK